MGYPLSQHVEHIKSVRLYSADRYIVKLQAHQYKIQYTLLNTQGRRLSNGMIHKHNAKKHCNSVISHLPHTFWTGQRTRLIG